MSLAWASGRQQTSLWDRPGWNTGSSAPLRSESHTTNALPFFLNNCSCDLSDWLHGSGRPTKQTFPQNPGPHVGSGRAPGKAREARRGFCCLPKQGPVSTPQLLGLLLPDGKRVRATLAELSCIAFLSGWKVQLYQSVSLDSPR